GDVQLPRQPAGVRGGGPGDADLRRGGLPPANGGRAHLTPPPSVPHHRGVGGDPDAQGGPEPLRLRGRAPVGSQPWPSIRPTRPSTSSPPPATSPTACRRRPPGRCGAPWA